MNVSHFRFILLKVFDEIVTHSLPTLYYGKSFIEYRRKIVQRKK